MDIHGQSMGILGSPWISMETHGLSMDIQRYQWNSMIIWISMDSHGYPWISMDHPWISMDIYGYEWISMDMYPWISMDVHRPGGVGDVQAPRLPSKNCFLELIPRFPRFPRIVSLKPPSGPPLHTRQGSG